MTTTLNTLTLDQLLAMKSKYDAEILARGAGSVAKKEKKAKRVGVSGPWSDYTKKVLAEHAEAVTAFKAAAESKLGAHLKWLSQYKASHEEEWLAYHAAWKLEHPKGAAVAAEAAETVEHDDTASVASSATSTAAPAAGAKRRGPKKLTEMTTEERAAHDSKVAERKAKKTTATPAEAEARAAAPVAVAAPEPQPQPEAAVAVAAPEPVPAAPAAVASLPASPAAEAEEVEATLLPFEVDNVKYLRYGIAAAAGEVDWASGDLWQIRKGVKGAYVGELMEDGSINTDADEPTIE
jgi:hypothetical protein